MRHLQHYDETDHDFVETFLRNLYVDDSTGGGDNTNEVLQFYLKAKSRLLEAGLNLRKWRSNDEDLQKEIEKRETDDPAEPDEKM